MVHRRFPNAPRRTILQGTAALGGAAIAASWWPAIAQAQAGKVKVGLLCRTPARTRSSA